MGDLEEGEIVEKEVDVDSGALWQSETSQVSANRRNESNSQSWPSQRPCLSFEYNHGKSLSYQERDFKTQTSNKFDDIDWNEFGFSDSYPRSNPRSLRVGPRDSWANLRRDESFYVGHPFNTTKQRFSSHQQFRDKGRVRPRRRSFSPRNDTGFHRMRQEFASARGLKFSNREDTPKKYELCRRSDLVDKIERRTTGPPKKYAESLLSNANAKLNDASNSDFAKGSEADEKLSFNATEVSHSAEGDEYDLDDFQLLLERHRLIQQQLSVIGQQEKCLEGQTSGFDHPGNGDDDADFVVIPNPNCIDEIFEVSADNEVNVKPHSLNHQNHYLPINSENISKVTEKVTTSHFNDIPAIEGKENVAVQNEPICTNSDVQHEKEELAGNAMYVSKDVDPQKHAVQQPNNEKRSRPRRRRRMRFKNKNSNLQEISKEKKKVESAKSKRRQKAVKDNSEESNDLAKKKKIMDDEDNYNLLPMEMDDEYEVVDTWLDDPGESMLQERVSDAIFQTKDNEPQITREPPEVEDVSVSAEKCLLSPMAQIPVPLVNDNHDAMQEEGEDSHSEDSHDEESDDIVVLRHQLLQSLVTKRAEKARAVISEQQGDDSPNHDSMSLLQAKELAHNNVQTASFQITRPLPLTVANKRSRNASPASDNRHILSSVQESFVIQIGHDTDSDEGESDEDSDETVPEASKGSLFGGAISDFLKEARHGLPGKPSPNSSPSVPVTSLQSAKDTKETLSTPNAAIIERLKKCISEAVAGIQKNRDAVARDSNLTNFISKKISLQKLKIEQQDQKIKRLRHLLATGEKTKKTLVTQSLEFQDQVKSLRKRISFRSKNNKELDAEVMRARALIKNITLKDQLAKRRKNLVSQAVPSTNAGSALLKNLEGSKAELMNQISKAIAQMKTIMARKTQSLPKKSTKLLNVARRRSRQSNEGSATVGSKEEGEARELPAPTKTDTSAEKVSEGRSSLRAEKERLQRLEKELQEKLKSMKRLSDAKLLASKSSKGNLEASGGRKKIEIVARASNPLADQQVMNALRQASETVTKPPLEATLSNAESSTGPSSSKVETSTEEVQLNPSILDGLDEDAGSDNGEGSGAKLSVLFQDERQLNRIQQELLQRELLLPSFESIPRKEKTMVANQTTPKEPSGAEQSSRLRFSNEQNALNNSDPDDISPVSDFAPYTSPLLNFRSYRLSPWFRTKEKKAVSSSTYSHKIDPLRMLCPYDWSGKCLDNSCRKQHASEAFGLSDDELLQDLILYEPRIAQISAKDSLKLKQEKAAAFVKKLRDKYGTKMTVDHLVVLLIHDIKELRKQAQNIKGALPYNINLVRRPFLRHAQTEDDNEYAVQYASEAAALEERMWKRDLNREKEESQEMRYFEEDYDIQKTLEALVVSNPSDVKSWILLAKHNISKGSKVHQKFGQIAENENQSLNILSKALEANPYSEDLWLLYLDIFSKRNNVIELREMFVQAVDYCRSFTVWWKCLQLEKSYDDKVEICLDIVGFLLEAARDKGSFEVRSHRLLETVAYLMKLEVERHKTLTAISVVQAALGVADVSMKVSSNVPRIAGDLTPTDLAILWLCHISLVAFGTLPQTLFDPTDSGPSRVVNKSVGVFNWMPGNVTNEAILRRLFGNATRALERHPAFHETHDQTVMQLYANSIQLEISLGHVETAVDTAERLSKSFAEAPSFSLMLIEILKMNSDGLDPEVATRMGNLILLRSDECIYKYAKLLLAKGTEPAAVNLLTNAVEQKFEFPSEDTARDVVSPSVSESIRLYRRLLGISSELVTKSKPVVKENIGDRESKEFAYRWLNFCLLLEITKFGPDSLLYNTGAEEAFQIAVNSYTSRENREILWLENLRFKQRIISESAIKDAAIKSLLDSVRRCLACIPSTKSLPFHQNLYWNDYSFHNEVVAIGLQFIPESDETQYLKESLKMMPTNTKLALRTCQCALANGGTELARTVYGFILKTCPYSRPMWKMALSVELKSKKIKELIASHCLSNVSLSDIILHSPQRLLAVFVLFEIAHGRNAKEIQTRILEIATTATPSGIEIMDYVRSLLT